MEKYPNIKRLIDAGNFEYINSLRNTVRKQLGTKYYYREKFTGEKTPIITADEVNAEVEAFLARLPEVFANDMAMIYNNK
jgi:hypothetical protein